MRASLPLALAATLLLATPAVSQADDLSRVPAQLVGHSKHGHHHHHAHGRWHHHSRHYHRSRVYSPSRVRFHLSFGSLYSPYRSYYAHPYCYGTRVYRYGYSTYPYGTYYGVSSRLQHFLPPTTQPAEIAFGPQAVKQFMGVDRDFALGDLKADEPALVLGKPVANKIEPKVRQTNWEARRRALSFMNRGDDAFARGQYAAAIADYDKAIENAPDLAEGYLRRAFGLIAAGEYESAFAAVERAVAVDPAVVNDPRFEAEDLYQGNDQVKKAHLEKVAEAALADRNDGKPLVLLGLMLHFDRQVLRAERFFKQAIIVSEQASPTARAFLPKANDPI